MENKLTGTIARVFEKRSGEKNGKQWAVQEYLLEFPVEGLQGVEHKCLFQVFGAERIEKFGLKVGDRITAWLEFDAREYNGKYYNQVKCYKIERK